MSSDQRLRCDLGVIGLALFAVVINVAGAPGAVRAVFTLLAALLVPGWAILTWLEVDAVLSAFALTVGLSLMVDTFASLVVLWTGWRSPSALAIVVVVACAAAITADIRRRRQTAPP